MVRTLCHSGQSEELLQVIQPLGEGAELCFGEAAQQGLLAFQRQWNQLVIQLAAAFGQGAAPSRGGRRRSRRALSNRVSPSGAICAADTLMRLVHASTVSNVLSRATAFRSHRSDYSPLGDLQPESLPIDLGQVFADARRQSRSQAKGRETRELEHGGRSRAGTGTLDIRRLWSGSRWNALAPAIGSVELGSHDGLRSVARATNQAMMRT